MWANSRLTNPEIGQQLFISRRTVHTHLNRVWSAVTAGTACAAPRMIDLGVGRSSGSGRYVPRPKPCERSRRISDGRVRRVRAASAGHSNGRFLPWPLRRTWR
ncbi:MAG: LuxR C-terminal-related transcriptional regulator [Pseudonocardiaceae bacterium]